MFLKPDGLRCQSRVSKHPMASAVLDGAIAIYPGIVCSGSLCCDFTFWLSPLLSCAVNHLRQSIQINSIFRVLPVWVGQGWAREGEISRCIWKPWSCVLHLTRSSLASCWGTPHSWSTTNSQWGVKRTNLTWREVLTKHLFSCTYMQLFRVLRTCAGKIRKTYNLCDDI